MPSKKKKYNARFPAGRIKKIMQTDEEVGKVAQAVPVIISRTLELFVESLLTKSMLITQARNAKTLTPSHMKQCILSENRFDFLKDLVKNIPDASVQEDNENNAIFEENLDKTDDSDGAGNSGEAENPRIASSTKEEINLKEASSSSKDQQFHQEAGCSKNCKNVKEPRPSKEPRLSKEINSKDVKHFRGSKRSRQVKNSREKHKSLEVSVPPSPTITANYYKEQSPSTSRTPVIQYGPKIAQAETAKFNFSVSSLLGMKDEPKLHVTIASEHLPVPQLLPTSNRSSSGLPPRVATNENVPPLIPISLLYGQNTSDNLCIDEDYDN